MSTDPDRDDIVSRTAKQEATRQAIILAFTLAGAVALVWVQRTLTEPDVGRTVKMQTALSVKRFANKRVDFWQRIADKAATAYNREKS